EREDVHEPKKIYKFLTLEAKKVYQIKLEYKQDNTERAIMRFLWDTPSNSLEAEAIALAKESDVVVLCMGLSPMLEGEEMKVKVDGFSGGDRLDIKLPSSQTNLMKKIKELGKPMVLVMLNGSAVAINWENDNIPAILEAWYPGQAGGTAIADILFGDYNPSGRLPLTFYKDINDIPAFNDYSMKGKTYRYFQGKPLYDFGFGLSYTTFEYTNLTVPVENPTTKNIDFTVDVTNTGAVAGDEVVEVYFTNPQGDQLNTIRTLINFDRVALKAGETKKVSFSIQPKQLAQLNANNSFQLSAGTVNLSVGGMQASPERLQAKKVIEKNIKIVGETVVF
ncbi:glycoside hydrolase family 3 C-terminal domain-containing protein, partial [Flavobacterium sp.]|uniref:glycoside hydrolase family 3 C-terminal domain-containing protein n=1 Tax=Flavobacterium sp. TaxID=239 RepID=UPI00261BC0F8